MGIWRDKRGEKEERMYIGVDGVRGRNFGVRSGILCGVVRGWR